MSPRQRIRARFTEATPLRANGGVGVSLRFRPDLARPGLDRVDDFADLGPALTVPAVAGLGKVLRILRAARIAAPLQPLDLVGHEEAAAALLARAVGTPLRLEVRPRFRMRFAVWTEQGVEVVDDVLDLREEVDAYVVRRRDARVPVRFDRRSVVRQRTESEHWHEVLDIERP
jgi:hypothetical protein